MIGKIKGKLIELDGNVGLVETTGGISYEINLTPALISSNQLGKAIELYTYFQVRDDAHVLFGFKTREEQKLFKLLISVSGVGPKIAFTVVSFSKESELMSAIKANDVNYFSKIPGLGKKTAMKIILELSQKLQSEFKMEKMYLSEEDKTVVDALVSLGFKSQEAKSILTKIPKNLSVEEKIREALRSATSKKN
jgi:holliday junction DNA helicase RuvA